MLTPIIEVQQLNHFYGRDRLRRQVLFDIHLSLRPGEIVIMNGPSGSGKSTLLSLIGGLRSVQSGGLQVLGQALQGASDRALENLRRQIGFIFQSHSLLTALTAQQNVQMSLVLDRRVNMREAKVRSRQMLAQVGLADHCHQYPHQLSVGQQQRVAVARALVHQPPLILADEPTAALDKVSGRTVVELMQQLAKRQQCTILLVTHDSRILDIADRIIELEDGCLTTPQSVLEAVL
ncbi:MAG: ATP-binding cassette domain-containing protein [Phormidesmis sp.]